MKIVEDAHNEEKTVSKAQSVSSKHDAMQNASQKILDAMSSVLAELPPGRDIYAEQQQ